MTSPSERPSTVAGLQAKRAELVKVRDQLKAEARKITCDSKAITESRATDRRLRADEATYVIPRMRSPIRKPNLCSKISRGGFTGAFLVQF